MRTATGLTLIALGAILAFAVRGHPSFLNIQVVGWVIMATGVAGMLLPRRGYGWLRRRMVLRRGPRGPVVSRVEETRLPPYAMLNPGTNYADTMLNPEMDYPDSVVVDADAPPPGEPPSATVGKPAAEDIAADPDAERQAAQRAAAEREAVERAAADWAAADRAAPPGGPAPAEEVVEQFIEE